MKLLTTLVAIALLSGCASVGLSEQQKNKVVDAALEPGKTAWCLDLAVIEPVCIFKDKEVAESTP